MMVTIWYLKDYISKLNKYKRVTSLKRTNDSLIFLYFMHILSLKGVCKMKNILKHYTLIGIIFVTMTGTLSHFVYEWSGENPFLALFFPINETTWEHMKLIFFPSIVYAVFMVYKLYFLYPHIIFTLSAGIFVGTFSIPVIFYTYTRILGFHTLFLDIITFLLGVIITFLSTYFFTVSCHFKKQVLWIIALLFLTLCFFFFSIIQI